MTLIHKEAYETRAKIGEYIAWGLTLLDGYMTHLYIASFVKSKTYVDLWLLQVSANTLVGILGSAFISLYQLTVLSLLFNPKFFATAIAIPKNVLSQMSPEASRLYKFILWSGLAALAFGAMKVCQINLQGTVSTLGIGDSEFARFIAFLIMLSGEVALLLSSVNKMMASETNTTGGFKTTPRE